MYENTVQHTKTQDPVRPTTSGTGGIVANGLGKRFGDLWALRNLDLHVAPGTVLGLLGHNGAGKTTAIRILTTLSKPTEGSATVAGLDVATQGAAVRGRIGVASQQSTVDGLMSARLNLQTIGRLRGMMAELEPIIDRAYEIGALGASDAAVDFYRNRGWVRWQGRSYALTPNGVVRTPAEDDGIFVWPSGHPINIEGDITCDWRDGDVW